MEGLEIQALQCMFIKVSKENMSEFDIFEGIDDNITLDPRKVLDFKLKSLFFKLLEMQKPTHLEKQQN